MTGFDVSQRKVTDAIWLFAITYILLIDNDTESMRKFEQPRENLAITWKIELITSKIISW